MGYLLNIPRIQAERTIAALATSPVQITPDAAYDLVLASTGNKEQAEAAHNALTKAILRRGETPP